LYAALELAVGSCAGTSRTPPCLLLSFLRLRDSWD
jgi:hypothetical protein